MTNEAKIDAIAFKRSEQAQAWSTAREAIAEYLLLYGVREERAYGAATDILDDDLNTIIGEEGDG